jgi:hypothetical protein
VLKNLGEVLKLLLHKETCSALRKLNTNHGRVSTMSSTESIVDIDISKASQASTELLDGLGVSLGFVTILILSRALLLNVETKVFQENDLTTSSRLAGSFNFGTNTVIKESHRLTKEFLDLSSDGSKRVLFLAFAIGTTKVGHQDYSSSTVFQGILDGRQSLNNTIVVGDLSFFQGNVEVDSNKNNDKSRRTKAFFTY